MAQEHRIYAYYDFVGLVGYPLGTDLYSESLVHQSAWRAGSYRRFDVLKEDLEKVRMAEFYFLGKESLRS